MLQIIDATSRRALEQFLARDRGSDRAFGRRVTAIVDRVRAGGDRALVGFARRFDGVRPPLEVSAEEMRTAAAAVPADVRRAIRQAARHIARVAARQIPRGWAVEVASGVSVQQRVEPLSRVCLLYTSDAADE